MTLQHRIQYVLDELVASGTETGLQVAVDHRGHRVVDAVAGVADSRTGRPVGPETLFFSFSTGKGMAALIAHLLVGNGLVGYDTRRPRSAGPAEEAAVPTPTRPPGSRSRSPRTASPPTSAPPSASRTW
jgi:hypothetical protein